MLLKTLWDIHSNGNSLWVEWIHAYYLFNKDVWSWTHGSGDHHLFKNIQTLRDRIIGFTRSIHSAKQLLSSWFINGKFSTYLTYDWLRIKHDQKPWMTHILKSYVPPKYSFILWLALRGRLNTKDIWFEQPEDISCVFCKSSKESIAHLFFQCTFVKSIWSQLRNWHNIRRSMTTLLSTVKWIKKEFKVPCSEVKL